MIYGSAPQTQNITDTFLFVPLWSKTSGTNLWPLWTFMKMEHFDKLFIVSCGLFWPDLQNGNAELTIIYQNISYWAADIFKSSHYLNLQIYT